MTRAPMRKITKQWTMRDGRKIHICDMGNDHLLRTISMLKRIHASTLREAYGIDSCVSSEASNDAIESVIAQLESTESNHPLFDDLLNEARRRGLDLE